MVLHNPNNWHWVDKNCLPWTKDYFNRVLLVSAQEGAASAEISRVASVEGDCDVCQRKGKVIGLYDLQVELEFTGKAGEAEVKGKVRIPEVMYNTEEDEFVFNVSVENSSPETLEVRQLVKSKIVPQLRKALTAYGVDLIKENGETIQHKAGQAPAGQASASASTSASASAASSAQLRMAPTFTASAEQLYEVLTDPRPIAAWSRSNPEMAPAAPGSSFRLFGGNVEGSYSRLEKPTVIEQKWRLRDWKQGHYSLVRFTMTQDVGVTTLNVEWNGIPIGQEEVVRSNFTNYYVHPIMLTFGFGVPS